MMRSNRGAARISAVWLITVLVLFFAALAFGFVAYDDRANSEDSKVKAQQAQIAAEAQADRERQRIRDVSKVVGWYDETQASPVTEVTAMKADLERLKGKFPGTEGAADLETLVQPMISAYDAVVQEGSTLRTRVQSLQSELDALRATQRDVTRAKDGEIADLQQRMTTEAQSFQRRIDDLEGRLAQSLAQNSELDTTVRNVRSEMAAKLAEKDKLAKQLNNQVASMAQKLDFTLPSKRNMPDGSVLQVSEALGIGFIDLGAQQRLVSGLRFRVESGTPGTNRLKARAEVLEVGPTQSKVAFYEVVDRFDPVTPGDVVVNELYDPVGKRSAVLAGRFDGRFNEKDLVPLLERIGVTVYPADQLDRTIDYLIVGNELWNDPETGEQLEEPLQPSELAVYKKAESLNVTILPLKRVREFFAL